VEGEFRKGDVVRICDGSGAEIGRGLSNYSAEDAVRLRGLQSDQIASLVGGAAYPELVHRDNLVVVG
jgi:glutamate 5-kinase